MVSIDNHKQEEMKKQRGEKIEDERNTNKLNTECGKGKK